MNTDEIMQVALEQAALDAVPADSAVHIPGAGLRRALFSIDLEVGELLFAREAGFDVVVSHHPAGDGPSSVHFTDVMWRQVDQMLEEGVDEPVARAALAERVATVHRRRHMTNHNRVLDTARLLGLPLMNIHLPPDIVTREVLRGILSRTIGPDSTVAELITTLSAIPEMEASLVKPEAWVGRPENRLGRTTVAIAGGTNGGYPVFRAYYEAGVRTILAMHIDEGDFLRLRAEAAPDWNFVVTGHMPSDSIGINRLIWGLEDRGLECTRTSGIIGAPRPAAP
jgi:hypothetical protein